MKTTVDIPDQEPADIAFSEQSGDLLDQLVAGNFDLVTKSLPGGFGIVCHLQSPQ